MNPELPAGQEDGPTMETAVRKCFLYFMENL